MKNKETVIGWILIVLLMIGFVMYQNKKMAEEQAKKKQEQKTEQPANKPPTTAKPTATTTSVDTTGEQAAVEPAAADTASNESKYGEFASSGTGAEQTFVLEDSLLKLTLTNKGGQIKSLELKHYKTWDKKPLVLFDSKTSTLSYQLPINGNRVIDTKDFYFEAVPGETGKSIALRLNAGDGKYFEQKYTLNNSYLFNYDVSFVGLDSVIPEDVRFMSANWESKLKPFERDLSAERRYSALYYKIFDGDVTHLDDTKESDEYTLNAPMEWISFKQQFFNATLFSPTEILPSSLTTNFAEADTLYVKKYGARFNLAYNSDSATHYAFQFYAGPNHFNTLKSLDKGAEEVIKLGPDMWVFAWMTYITRFIIWIFNIFDKLHLNYGIIILLMTLILKLALHPLTAKSIESAAKMKILAPELAALKEKYGEDQTRMGQEQMKLYNRAGVSPLGGCLPLLLQMPILIAMYNFFPASIELRQESFLWATDLSSYDSIVSWSPAVLGFSHLSLFTVLMTITSILQAVMSNQMNAMGNQQPGMKYLPYIMPVMLMFLFNSFPAALTYYYLLQNLLGIGHQWVIQKFFIDDDKLRKQIEEHKKNPKPKSGWQKKIMEMQKQAEQRTKQRNGQKK